MTILPPGGAPFVVSRDEGNLYPSIAVSRDGQKLAFVARGEGASGIYLRELGSLAARALDGTDNANSPSFRMTDGG
jgi:hypothetical protein